MKRSMKLFFIILLSLLFFHELTASSNDITTADTAINSKNIIQTVNTETKSLTNYFSASKIIISLLIIVITYIFLRILSGILKIWAERNTKHRVTIKGLIPLISIIAWVGSLTFIMVAVFHPPVASILALSASIGVAVGFASQDLLKNIFGGIIIIFDKPFQIGDKIQIGNYYGEIVGIGLHSTRLKTPDDSLVSVPNSEIMNQSLANSNSGEDNCQVVTEIFLPLTSDIHKVKQLATEAAQVSQHIFLNKPVTILFLQENIGHKVMLKVKIKAYVNDIRNEFAFKSEITEVLTQEFSEYYIKLSSESNDMG